jgi:predicted membrane GTPase involved in stress response
MPERKENRKEITYIETQIIATDKEGLPMEACFFYLQTPSANGRGNFVNVLITHVRRRTKAEFDQEQPDNIWKKVKGDDSKYTETLMGNTLQTAKGRIIEWLANTIDNKGQRSLLSYMPEDQPLKSLDILINEAVARGEIGVKSEEGSTYLYPIRK